MSRGVREGVGHSTYLSPSARGRHDGRSDIIDRAMAARDGSERLLDAMLRYYERRAAA